MSFLRVYYKAQVFFGYMVNIINIAMHIEMSWFREIEQQFIGYR